MSGTLDKPTGGLPRCPGFLRENIKAFLDGELAPLRRALMRWHLTRCAHCREEAAWLRRLGEDMRTLEKSAPSANLRHRILANLPPPAPMRPPLKIWRPERAALRYAPNLALGAAVGAFALGGSFAALSHAPHEIKKTDKPPVFAEIADSPPAPETKTGSATKAKTDPFVVRPAVTDDPTSRKANALYHAAAHRLALQRQREARLAAGQVPVKIADAAPPLFTLTPNPDAANLPELRKRLEALAVQAGGEMKTLSDPQIHSLRVVPNVALDTNPHYRPASPAPNPAIAQTPAAAAEAETGAAQMALRIPRRQWKPFWQAMQTFGTLKRAPLEPKKKQDAPVISKPDAGTPDQIFTRDTQSDEAENFVSFRLRFLPAK